MQNENCVFKEFLLRSKIDPILLVKGPLQLIFLWSSLFEDPKQKCIIQVLEKKLFQPLCTLHRRLSIGFLIWASLLFSPRSSSLLYGSSIKVSQLDAPVTFEATLAPKACPLIPIFWITVQKSLSMMFWVVDTFLVVMKRVTLLASNSLT